MSQIILKDSLRGAHEQWCLPGIVYNLVTSSGITQPFVCFKHSPLQARLGIFRGGPQDCETSPCLSQEDLAAAVAKATQQRISILENLTGSPGQWESPAGIPETAAACNQGLPTGKWEVQLSPGKGFGFLLAYSREQLETTRELRRLNPLLPQADI